MRVYLPPVNAGQLKRFAVFTMLIDHIAYAFLERACGSDGRALMYSFSGGPLLCRVMRAVGRQAFPVFCFFLVEGFYLTRNRLRYLVQILVFAALAQIPFQQCFFRNADKVHANVLFTLAMGLLAVWCVEEMRKAFLPAQEKGEAGETEETGKTEEPTGQIFRRLIFLAASAGTVWGFSQLALFVHSDYSYGGVVLIVILYLLRNYRISALFISWLWLWWYNKLEVYAAPAFFLLACYNGKRGKQHKYFYYLFYPAHLAVLWLVRRYFFGA